MYNPNQNVGIHVIDRLSISDYLKRHMDWSEHSFGPWKNYKYDSAMMKVDESDITYKAGVPYVKYRGPIGVVDHIRRELVEIEKDGYFTPTEWIDVVILAIDGYIRSGGDPSEFLMQLFAKQRKNFNREWPDWKTADRTKAIEHVRGIQD